MSFKEFINFKKRTGSSSKNLSEDKISHGFVDLDELFKNISGIESKQTYSFINRNFRFWKTIVAT